jgi:hypothetical protein
MTVCPVFAVGLDGKCGTGEQRPQGGPDHETIDSKIGYFVDVRFAALSELIPVQSAR